MHRILFLLLLAVGVPAMAAAREAFTADATLADVRVPYHDLDLRSPAGLAEFDRRLARAARAVCTDEPSAVMGFRIEMARCRIAKRAEVAALREAVLARPTRVRVASASLR